MTSSARKRKSGDVLALILPKTRKPKLSGGFSNETVTTKSQTRVTQTATPPILILLVKCSLNPLKGRDIVFCSSDSGTRVYVSQLRKSFFYHACQLSFNLFLEVPTSERRLKKDVKNYRMLQLFVIELERENAALRRENKTLRARADVLLDAMVNICHTSSSFILSVKPYMIKHLKYFSQVFLPR